MKLAALLLVGCSSHSTATSGGPGMTDADVHPAFGALRPGHSTFADVQRQFPTAEVMKDSAFEGTDIVNAEGHPGISVDAKPSSVVLARFAGATVVFRMETEGPDLCSWVQATVRPHVTAVRCRNDVRVVEHATNLQYCLRDGSHEVQIFCRREGNGTDDLTYRYLE